MSSQAHLWFISTLKYTIWTKLNRSESSETLLNNNIVENNPKYCIIPPLEAEITKISINGYITTKLSFVNMIQMFVII